VVEPDINSSLSGSVIALVRGQLHRLVPSEAKVAQYLIDFPGQVIFQSVSDVGLAAGTASSTVVRCAQRLGFSGFQDLKISLARELGAAAVIATTVEASPGWLLDDVLLRAGEAMRSASRTIDREQFGAVMHAMQSANRVLLAGIGTSAPVAQDAAFRLRIIGLPADAPTEIYAQQMHASALGPDDVLLAVSHTGSTRHTVTCVERARQAGAVTVALTSFARSPLTEIARYALVAGASGTSVELEAVAGRIAHIAVIDALILELASADPERAERHRRIYEQILGDHRF